ncbi:MAG: biotin/lipoyl-containing protein, partial [Sphingomonadaceae bacterium]
MPGFFLIDGATHQAALLPGQRIDMTGATVAADGNRIWVHLDGQAHELIWQDAITHYEEEAGGNADDVARAPMPGSVIQVSVAVGDAVVAGDMMMIIESMKLETVIKAPRD